MFFKTLQWRLVGFFCLISVCLLVPVWLVLNQSVEDLYHNNFCDSIEAFKDNLDNEIGSANPTIGEIRKNTVDSEDPYVVYTIKSENRSCTIFNKKLNEIDSSTDSAYEYNKDDFLNQLVGSGNFIKALAGETGYKINSNQEFFDYAVPFRKDYILYFRYYKKALQGDINEYNSIMVKSLVIAFLIAFILGYMFSKTITVPIVRIMHKAKKVASGDFDLVLDVKSDDEIGKLTSTFNDMADNLKSTLTEISSEKNKVETILNYMTDGVIAFNIKGEVIHTNPASLNMLGTESYEMNFNEFARKYNFNVNIEDVLYLEDLSTRVINIDMGEKIIRVYFAVFTDEYKKPEGIIAVLQDITEQQKLENMRKDFVANVSHEMRTPLTSIKSYTETLLDGALEDRETTEHFLSVINSEADRMTRLVKDLLQLTRLDNHRMDWKFGNISFAGLVKSTVEKMQIEAANKNQKLECFTIGEIPELYADHDRIEQVMINIISNALKYTPEGGNIMVYIGRSTNEVYAKVADNGIGIPEQDLPRLFERFYRVDKARSREMGGTGLGLSIAKEIVEAHSGTINITSQYGKGTEVTIRLPISAIRRMEAI